MPNSPDTPTPSAAEIEAWRLRAERAVSRWVGFNDEGCPASVQFARQLLSTIATLTARSENAERLADHAMKDLKNTTARVAKLEAALRDLHDECVDYARINKLHNDDGSPATTGAMKHARRVMPELATPKEPS